MALDFSPDEIRVLGVLIEKERATPEYYPLTLNSLTTGCNQKSNRDPVVAFTQTQVMNALDTLMRRRLVGRSSGSSARSEKFRHALPEAWGLSEAETAVLAVLLLRGAQTVGELRARSHRMFAFETLDEIEQVLNGLADREEPLVVLVPRQPGQKEARHAHLFEGEARLPEPAPTAGRSEGADGRTEALEGAVSELELSVASLESRLESLSQAFDSFRSQF
jgi:uncharacterized protein